MANDTHDRMPKQMPKALSVTAPGMRAPDTQTVPPMARASASAVVHENFSPNSHVHDGDDGGEEVEDDGCHAGRGKVLDGEEVEPRAQEEEQRLEQHRLAERDELFLAPDDHEQAK